MSHRDRAGYQLTRSADTCRDRAYPLMSQDGEKKIRRFVILIRLREERCGPGLEAHEELSHGGELPFRIFFRCGSEGGEDREIEASQEEALVFELRDRERRDA